MTAFIPRLKSWAFCWKHCKIKKRKVGVFLPDRIYALPNYMEIVDTTRTTRTTASRRGRSCKRVRVVPVTPELFIDVTTTGITTETPIMITIMSPIMPFMYSTIAVFSVLSRFFSIIDCIQITEDITQRGYIKFNGHTQSNTKNKQRLFTSVTHIFKNTYVYILHNRGITCNKNLLTP